jgi:uncharacterized delta-60 repeat protein
MFQSSRNLQMLYRLLRKLPIARVFALALVWSGIGWSVANTAFAAPGDLDTSFGTAGTVATTFGGSGDNRMWSMAFAPDQKIVGAGACSVPGGFAFCVARYLPNGQLDPSFNGNGKLIDPIGSGGSHGRAVGVQTDGRIVVAGFCVGGDNNFQLCLRRYLPNGAPDVSFNSNVPSKPFGTKATSSFGNHLAVQRDGAIIVIGDCYAPEVAKFQRCAARFSSSGKLDPAFAVGEGAKVYSDVIFGQSGGNYARRVAIDPEGGYFIIGRCDSVVHYPRAACVMRIHESGEVDIFFGLDGTYYHSSGSDGDGMWKAIRLPNRKILTLSVWTDPSLSTQGYLTRALAHGRDWDIRPNPYQLVNALGLTARQHVAGTRVPTYFYDATVEPDGKIVLAGTCVDTEANNRVRFCLRRIFPDGTSDRSSSRDPIAAIEVSVGTGDAYGAHLLRTQNGNYLIGGSCAPSNGVFDFCLAQLEGGPFEHRNCKLDLDGDGSVLGPTDSLLLARIARGVTGDALFNGVRFAPNATRTSWNALREYLVKHCELSLQQ